MYPLFLLLSPFTVLLLRQTSPNDGPGDCQESQVYITPSGAFLFLSIHQMVGNNCDCSSWAHMPRIVALGWDWQFRVKMSATAYPFFCFNLSTIF